MAKSELWLHYKPSLFQHVGTHSSLKGKVQKLKVSQLRLLLVKDDYLILIIYLSCRTSSLEK